MTSCFLCCQVIDTTTTSSAGDDDKEETTKIGISTLCELLSSSSRCRKISPQFGDKDERCEFCPICAPLISEMEQLRYQISLLEEQIGLKINTIREILADSASSLLHIWDNVGPEKVQKLRTIVLKLMENNDDQQDDNVWQDEIEVKVEEDDENLYTEKDDEILDDYMSYSSTAAAVELNIKEETEDPLKYDDDYDESAFCITPHPQKRGRGRPRKSDAKLNPPPPRTKQNPAELNPTSRRFIKVENNPPLEPSRRSSRARKPVLPLKGVEKMLTVSLERISFVPTTKSSPSESSSSFEDTTKSDKDSLTSDEPEIPPHKSSHAKTYKMSHSAQTLRKIHPHKCPSCTKSFLASATLSLHLARFHSIPCPSPGCPAAFCTIKAREAHRKSVHPRAPPGSHETAGKTRAESVQLAQRVIAFYKNEANRDARKTTAHFRLEGVPRSSVHRYLIRFKDEDTVKFKKSPGPKPKSERGPETQIINRPFKCSSCPKSFLMRGALLSHVARDHTRGPKEHVCHVCGKDFYTVYNLRNHLRSHDESFRPRCETCGERFLHLSTLQAHEIREHGADPMVCDECGATFTSLKGLREHKWRHTGIKPHKCDQCDASFSETTRLKAHLASHSAQRPHPCPHCERAFKIKSQLYVHVKRVHTAGYVTPTPHKCAQCERSFQFPNVLKAHVLQAHTGERPFACDQCGKGFVVKSALTLHLKGKHGIDVAPVVKNRLPRSKRDTFQ